MSAQFDISVVICTHAPRPDYFSRVLNALRTQSLPRGRWELLLVDNSSLGLIAAQWDLSWHPHAQHLREEKVGLTCARLRGIAEATGGIIVFVDDDNVLAETYLESAFHIGCEFKHLGAWGGRVTLKFESSPPAWVEPYLTLLARREFERDKWSNSPDTEEHLPYGTGLCVRREVAEAYRLAVVADPHRLALDRRGHLLISGGDVDLAMTAFDLQMGTGLFRRLELTHLIPSARLDKTYLLSLIESIEYSAVILAARRGRDISRRRKTFLRRVLGRLKRQLTMERYQREFFEAAMRGRLKALEELS